MKNLVVLISAAACLSACFTSCDHVSKRKLKAAKGDSLIGNLATASLILDSSDNVYKEPSEKLPASNDSLRIFGAIRPKYKTPAAN